MHMAGTMIVMMIIMVGVTVIIMMVVMAVVLAVGGMRHSGIFVLGQKYRYYSKQ